MARPCGSGNGVTGATKPSYFQTFQNKMETARLSRPTWRRRDLKKNFFQGFLDRGGEGATFATMVDAVRLRKRRDSKGNGKTGLANATKMCTFKTFATEVETARLCRQFFSTRSLCLAVFLNKIMGVAVFPQMKIYFVCVLLFSCVCL